MKSGKPHSNHSLKRWTPVLICLVVALAIGATATKMVVDGRQLSDEQNDKLALLKDCLDSPIEVHQGVSVSGAVRDLLRTQTGADALEQIAAAYDNFVFDRKNSEAYYYVSSCESTKMQGTTSSRYMEWKAVPATKRISI